MDALQAAISNLENAQKGLTNALHKHLTADGDKFHGLELLTVTKLASTLRHRIERLNTAIDAHATILANATKSTRKRSPRPLVHEEPEGLEDRVYPDERNHGLAAG